MNTQFLQTTWQSFAASQLLGDGSMLGNCLRWGHGEKQRNYVFWKREIVERLGLNPMSSFGVQAIYSCGVTLPNKELKLLAPVQLIRHLDSLGLLLWWLDDGSLIVSEKRNRKYTGSISRHGYLNTQSFSLKLNEKISQALYNHFGIETRIHRDIGGVHNRVYYRLYFNAINLRILIDIVRDWIPQIPKEMLYKLNMDYRPTRLSTSELFARQYNFV